LNPATSGVTGRRFWLPSGFRRGDDGELVPHEAEQEAIREMVALGAQGKALRAIAEAMQTIRSVMRGSQAS
jgi:hypothetical protein